MRILLSMLTLCLACQPDALIEINYYETPRPPTSQPSGSATIREGEEALRHIWRYQRVPVPESSEVGKR